MNKMIGKLKANAKELSLLYVEDEIESLESITVFLQSFFSHIDTAQNGTLALQKYKNSDCSYDLVITDISMPQMDGITFAKKVLEQNPEQTIVVVSGQEDAESLVELINLGISYFVRKPLDSNNMIKVLTKAVTAINNELELQKQKNRLHQLNQELQKEIKEQNLHLYHRLYYDALTKLPKRNKLVEDIKQFNPSCLMIINVDRFKDINSVYGHQVGDQVLVGLTEELLKIALEKNCILYNIGGDEFVMLHLECGDDRSDTALAGQIIEHFEHKEIAVKKQNSTIDILIKITIGSSKVGDDLFKTAQLALVQAQSKKLGFVRYHPDLELEKEPTADIEMAKLIKNAIKNNGVVPFFQPIITDDQIKYESLVRIVDKGRIISPALFLELAKKIRYYDKITMIMIEKSFQTFHGRKTKFSINLTFEDIQKPETVAFLLQKIEQYRVHRQLIVEIVESESLQDINLVQSFVETLKNKGVQIAIDDFGSGYSNFGYLMKLRPDYIKIDGSIMKTIDTDNASAMIAQTIQEFSQKLGAKTIGEFIHSKSVYEKAKQMQIDAFQGFYFAAPMESPNFYAKTMNDYFETAG